MSVSEKDLKDQLEGLDWGVGAPPAPDSAPESTAAADPATEGAASPSSGDALDIDVAVAGVKPPRVRRARKAAVRRGPNAQALLDAVKDGATVASATPPSGRRPRTAAPDVLVQANEGPATIALFDAMWKEVGSKLARSIGRAKASRQDAALGWYMLLLAMRERDAKKYNTHPVTTNIHSM